MRVEHNAAVRAAPTAHASDTPRCGPTVRGRQQEVEFWQEVFMENWWIIVYGHQEAHSLLNSPNYMNNSSLMQEINNYPNIQMSSFSFSK